MKANAEDIPNEARRSAEVETWLALGAGATLLLTGASRRSAAGGLIAAAGLPLLYRGATGRWPSMPAGVRRDDTRTALAATRGVHVRESVRLERSVPDVYRYWRRLENLPRFMPHLASVTETSARQSHWVARGPAGVAVEWDAEIINDVENALIAWRSLPGADVVSAGSVSFDATRGGRGTQVTVHLQYEPPGGTPGVWTASLFGREPSRTIREDLRRLKQLLEAGEVPRTTTT